MRYVVALAVLACVEGTADAKRIRADQIPNIGDRQITVTTLDRVRHRGDQLSAGALEVRLHQTGEAWEALPVADIGRIEVRGQWRYIKVSRYFLQLGVLFPALACFDATGGTKVYCWISIGTLTAPVFTAPTLAIAAVTAPVALARDGIRLLTSRKDYEIIH